MATRPRQVGNARSPGVLTVFDSFDRVGLLEDSVTSDGRKVWQTKYGAAQVNSTLMQRTNGDALSSAAPFGNDPTKPATPTHAFHGPWLEVGPHILSGNDDLRISFTVKTTGITALYVAFGIRQASAGATTTNGLYWHLVTGGSFLMAAGSFTGESTSGAYEDYIDHKALPRAGDVLTLNWEAATKRLFVRNDTKDLLLFRADFAFYNNSYTTTEGTGVAFKFTATTSGFGAQQPNTWEIADISIARGGNRVGAPHIDTGGAVEETALVRKTAGTAVFELWENGSRRAILGTVEVEGDSSFTIPFDARVLADPTGAGVELRIRHVGGSTFDIGAIQWDARFAAVDATEKTSTDSSTSVETATLVVTHTSQELAAGDDQIINFIDGERVFRTGSDTIVVMEAELVRTARLSKLPPDAIVASTNLMGPVTYIQDDPATMDALYLEAVDDQAGVDLRVSFPTPEADLYVTGPQRFRIQLKEI